jgi:periplasmic protein CpxP/Spy
MSKYVTFAMAVIIMLGTTLSVQAQARQNRQRPAAGNEMRQPERKTVTPEKRAEFMAKQLELTDAEKVKLQDFIEKQEVKAKQRQEEMKKVREAQREKIEADRKANQAELIKIIGNEKYQQMQSQRIARLEKENRMLKMRMMRKDSPSTHQKMMIERMKKAREGKNN